MAVLIIPFVKKTVLKWRDAQIAHACRETFLILSYAYVYCAYSFFRKFFYIGSCCAFQRVLYCFEFTVFYRVCRSSTVPIHLPLTNITTQKLRKVHQGKFTKQD